MSLVATKPIDAPALSPPRLSINGQLITLPEQIEFVIGRAGEDTSSLPDIDLLPFGGTASAGVSRKHARLVWNGEWQIQDMESANGTFVDRKRLLTDETRNLEPNNVIQIGKLYLVFHG
jgi:pSer/pThr/pTyr-binding forkhead associated (FHA) protein